MSWKENIQGRKTSKAVVVFWTRVVAGGYGEKKMDKRDRSDKTCQMVSTGGNKRDGKNDT